MTKKERQWSARIEAWQQSGKSQRVFCAEAGIALSTLQWWRRRLRSEHDDGDQSSFVEVALHSRELVPATSAQRGSVMLVYGPYQVEVSPGFDAQTLASVLDVVEGRQC